MGKDIVNKGDPSDKGMIYSSYQLPVTSYQLPVNSEQSETVGGTRIWLGFYLLILLSCINHWLLITDN